jgi:hypothetical protein
MCKKCDLSGYVESIKERLGGIHKIELVMCKLMFIIVLYVLFVITLIVLFNEHTDFVMIPILVGGLCTNCITARTAIQGYRENELVDEERQQLIKKLTNVLEKPVRKDVIIVPIISFISCQLCDDPIGQKNTIQVPECGDVFHETCYKNYQKKEKLKVNRPLNTINLDICPGCHQPTSLIKLFKQAPIKSDYHKKPMEKVYGGGLAVMGVDIV